MFSHSGSNSGIENDFTPTGRIGGVPIGYDESSGSFVVNTTFGDVVPVGVSATTEVASALPDEDVGFFYVLISSTTDGMGNITEVSY